MSSDSNHLVHMANQIAANLAAQGEATAVRETAEHIRKFWDPRMRAAILTAPAEALNPIARAAISVLSGPPVQ